MTLVPVRPRILAARQIDAVEATLARALGLDAERHVSAGLVTCDQDDALYAALDHATKHAEVDVVYAKSFYAGAAHASGPFSGEVLGVLAGPDPKEVAEGLWALRSALLESIAFARFDRPDGGGPTFFAHVIGETGRYLAPLAGIAPGEPLAYLIAPPLESVVGLDAALKAANVRLCTWFGPPTETNYGGAYLTGTLADVVEARDAFVAAIEEVVGSPQGALVRPERERL